MIVELIDEAVKAINEETKHKYKKAFYASDAYKCPRKLYFDFKNREDAEEYHPDTLRIFQNGEAVHERIIKYLERANILEAKEVEMPPNLYNVHGRADAVLKDGTIVEIKSINSKEVKDPLQEHIGQLQLYLYLYGKERGLILYESKQNNKIFEFEIIFDKKVVDEILQQFASLQPYLTKLEPPKRDKYYTEENYPCKYCNYKHLCYKNEKAEM